MSDERPAPTIRLIALPATCIASFVLVLLALAEALQTNPEDALVTALTVPLVLSAVTVGAVLVSRLPHHVVGRFLLAGGILAAVSTASGALADYGLNQHPGTVFGAVAFAVLSSATGGIYLGLLGGFVPLYFPTGRLLSPRWRAVVAIGFVATFLPVVTSVFGPLAIGTYPAGVTNPLALGGAGGRLVDAVAVASNVAGVAALLLVVVSVVIRYRRAQGVERAQLKWFAYVGLLVVPTLVIAILTSTATSGALAILTTIAWIVTIGGLALLPIAIGMAVLRYRLYEIDRIISRTIAYGVLSAVVGGLFVAFILALQAILAPVTRSNELAVAGSTLLVFSLFQPIRRRVQRLVDRRFNRTRYDAERTVAAFAARLSDEVDLEHLRAEIMAAVNAAVEPTAISLWLRD